MNYKLRILSAFKWFLFGFSVLFFVFPVKAAFIDVDVTHPYYHSIEFLSLNEVVKGHKEKNYKVFKPLETINRVEALKMILLAAGVPKTGAKDMGFPDVIPAHWYYGFVSAAYDHGIVKGFQDGKFHPGSTVRRSEFLKMLLKSFEVEIPQPNAEEEWYVPYTDIAKKFRLLPDADNPGAYLNRGEAAEIIFRTIQVDKNGFTDKYFYWGFGKASYYNEGFAGKPTASGEKYNPYDLTAAHRTLPFGTRLKVYNQSGDGVVVRVNDRGPYHKNRILDLSEAAFLKLAPVSTGVISVEFEVFSEPGELEISVPEQIRPHLSPASRQVEVPRNLEALLHSNNNLERIETKTNEDRKQDIKTQALFKGETIGLAAKDFFPNVLMRRSFPLKMPRGLVFEMQGTSLGDERYDEVTVFLHNRSTGEQTHFKTKMSGKNFVVPVYFFDLGKLDLGIVFDDQRESKVATMEVVLPPRDRAYPASDIRIESDLTVQLIPEESQVRFAWDTQAKRLTKLAFRQGNTNRYELVFEDGLGEFYFPFEFFKRFKVDEILSVDVFQSDSESGTFTDQYTNWKKVAYENFELIRGFPDIEVASISIKPFTRYHHILKRITLKGKVVLDATLRLNAEAYLTDSKGVVKAIPLVFQNESFVYLFEPKNYGTYIVEIISEAGDILFNRAIYVNPFPVLPVFPRNQTVVKNNSHTAIYDWINLIRHRHEKGALITDVNLREVAQKYAQRMVDENFIAHTSPRGDTPKDRMEGLGFTSFAENLAYGSDLNLALSGLENSGSHRQNILSDRWSRMGVGLAQNQKGEFYVVQIFAK